VHELIGARKAKHGEEPMVVVCVLRSIVVSCGRKCFSRMTCRYPYVVRLFVPLRLLGLCTKYALGCRY
jgi:hypothetical protein